jgi:hypothetical protein
LKKAVVAQLVERVLGKDEVTGSIPVNGSRILWKASAIQVLLGCPVSNPDRLKRDGKGKIRSQ